MKKRIFCLCLLPILLLAACTGVTRDAGPPRAYHNADGTLEILVSAQDAGHWRQLDASDMPYCLRMAYSPAGKNLRTNEMTISFSLYEDSPLHRYTLEEYAASHWRDLVRHYGKNDGATFRDNAPPAQALTLNGRPAVQYNTYADFPDYSVNTYFNVTVAMGDKNFIIITMFASGAADPTDPYGKIWPVLNSLRELTDANRAVSSAYL